jgi:L-lactate dehydrogenase complex protein LldG
MNSRERILEAVRRNQPAAVPLPELPDLQADAPATLEAFAAALQRMGGLFVMPRPGQTLAEVMNACHPEAAVVVSAAPELPGTRALPEAFEPGSLEDVDVGVVRAAFGVAETGSVFLSEREFRVNALGFLPQHLVVLLDPAALVAGLQHAYRHPGFFEARYVALMTGPSATADIEGILIRGAQGVRSLTVIVWPLQG